MVYAFFTVLSLAQLPDKNLRFSSRTGFLVRDCDERTRGLRPEFLEVRLERVEGQERVWGQGGYGVRVFAGGKARAVKSRILQGRIPPPWTHLNDFCSVVRSLAYG
jgi:hypothetical protein